MSTPTAWAPFSSTMGASVPTRVALSLLTIPHAVNGMCVFCTEAGFQGLYSFSLSSGLAVNGTSVLATTVGGASRWLAQGGASSNGLLKFNVLDYGAHADNGATDLATALQAAMNDAVQNYGGGHVFIPVDPDNPDGFYEIKTAVSINIAGESAVGAGLVISGVNGGAPIRIAASFAGGARVLAVLNGTPSVIFENLTFFVQTQTPPNCAAVIACDNGQRAVVRYCAFHGLDGTEGIVVAYAGVYLHAHDNSFYGCSSEHGGVINHTNLLLGAKIERNSIIDSGALGSHGSWSNIRRSDHGILVGPHYELIGAQQYPATFDDNFVDEGFFKPIRVFGTAANPIPWVVVNGLSPNLGTITDHEAVGVDLEHVTHAEISRCIFGYQSRPLSPAIQLRNVASCVIDGIRVTENLANDTPGAAANRIIADLRCGTVEIKNSPDFKLIDSRAALTTIELGGTKTRVRCTSSYSPSFLPTDVALELWLRSDLGVTLNGATVSGWADQSGVGDANRNQAQATAARQPAYTAIHSDWNGRPALSFSNALTQWMRSGNWAPAAAQPCTVFIVGKAGAGANNYAIDGDAGGAVRLAIISDGTTSVYAGAATVTKATDVRATPSLIVARVSGAASDLQVNEIFNRATGNPGGDGINQMTLGSRYSVAANQQWGGEIVEVIVATGLLTNAQIQTFVHYFNALYAKSWVWPQDASFLAEREEDFGLPIVSGGGGTGVVSELVEKGASAKVSVEAFAQSGDAAYVQTVAAIADNAISQAAFATAMGGSTNPLLGTNNVADAAFGATATVVTVGAGATREKIVATVTNQHASALDFLVKLAVKKRWGKFNPTMWTQLYASGMLVGLWLPQGIVNNGGVVDTWLDFSGNRNDLTAAGGLRPTYTAVGGPNGLPACTFGGAQRMATATLAKSMRMCTLLTVGTFSANNQTHAALSSGAGALSTNGVRLATRTESGTPFELCQIVSSPPGGRINPQDLTATYHMRTGMIHNQLQDFYREFTRGTQQSSGGTPDALDEFTIGADNGGANPLTGVLQAVCLLNQAFPAIDLNDGGQLVAELLGFFRDLTGTT